MSTVITITKYLKQVFVCLFVCTRSCLFWLPTLQVQSLGPSSGNGEADLLDDTVPKAGLSVTQEGTESPYLYRLSLSPSSYKATGIMSLGLHPHNSNNFI